VTNAEYADLCRSTCYALNLSDAEGLVDGKGVSVDGVTLGLFFDETEPESLHFYAEVGTIADGHDKLEKIETLMAINLELSSGESAAICLERESNLYLLRARIPCNAEVDGDLLARHLKAYAALVNDVRETVAV